MIIRPTRARALSVAGALGCALALVAVSASSGAPEGRPAPGCQGTAVTDGSGDANGQAPTATAAHDLTGAFFSYEPELGAKGVKANIQVANLQKQVPNGFVAANWVLRWESKDTIHYVEYELGVDGTEQYGFGTITASGAAESFAPGGATTGKLFDGPSGVIQIDVPATVARAGAKLEAPTAETFGRLGVPDGPGYIHLLDRAPDAGTGKAFTVESCAASDETSPPPTVPVPPPAPPSLDVTTKRLRAGGRAAIVALRSSGVVTNVRGRLLAGGRVVASGSLARVEGDARLGLRVRCRSRPPAARRGRRLTVADRCRLKRGVYRVAITGRDQQGRAVGANARVTAA